MIMMMMRAAAAAAAAVQQQESYYGPDYKDQMREAESGGAGMLRNENGAEEVRGWAIIAIHCEVQVTRTKCGKQKQVE
jgi:hypothetical protein